jgi:hypothetical protein
LYHAFVPLQILDEESSCLILALEPPGNVARDLAEYKRSIFREEGELSALAFPDVLALACFRSRPRPSRELLGAELEECWRGIEGSFGSEALIICRGLVYLSLRGPLAELSSRSLPILAKAGLLPFASPLGAAAPLPEEIGFFICRAWDRVLDTAVLAPPPELTFNDCSLAILGLRWSGEPFSALTWKLLARKKRRTGPASTPSRRLPRS